MQTGPSARIPRMIAAGSKVSRMAKAISACAHIHATACVTDTAPEGMGRERVRATAPSMWRSVMSFQVQPAPRIRKAPMPQPAKIHASSHRACPSASMASVRPHQQGRSRSHVPMGRSARDSRR